MPWLHHKKFKKQERLSSISHPKTTILTEMFANEIYLSKPPDTEFKRIIINLKKNSGSLKKRLKEWKKTCLRRINAWMMLKKHNHKTVENDKENPGFKM